MRELLRSNDAVLISFAEAILQEAGITSFVADQHISVTRRLDRRLSAPAAGRCGDDLAAARRALTEAGLEAWLVTDGEASA